MLHDVIDLFGDKALANIIAQMQMMVSIFLWLRSLREFLDKLLADVLAAP